MGGRWKYYVGGFLAIVVAVITWQLEAELVQGLQEPDSPNYYNKPYFLVWFLSGGYMIFLPMWFVTRLIKLTCKGPNSYSLISALHPKILFQEEQIWVMKLGALSSFPYFLCGYFWYLSIVHTSVTANTVIYDSAFVFIFLFSIILIREKVSILKLLSVVVSFIGLIVVVWAGSQSIENGVDQTLMGYILVATSTILCSLYDVVYKKYGTKPKKKEDLNKKEDDLDLNINSHEISDIIGSKNNIMDELEEEENENEEKQKVVDAEDIPLESSLLFQGTLGLVTIVAYWPGLVLLNFIGFEEFEWPDVAQFELLMINIVLDSTNSITFLMAINWTTPLFVGIGSLLNIPVSVFLDIVLHSYVLPIYGFIGIGCIVLGFALISAADIILNRKNTPDTCNVITKSVYN